MRMKLVWITLVAGLLVACSGTDPSHDGASSGSGGSTGTGGSDAGPPVPDLPDPEAPKGPVAMVDFDQQGRPSSEVTDIGYVAWPVDAAASLSKKVNGIDFTVSKSGPNGKGLASDWYKVLVNAPNYARLVGDGVTVEDGQAGAEIKFTIHGLPAGTHSLLTYHNQTESPDNNTFAPIDILVDGEEKLTGVKPSVRALSTADARSAYITFDAQEGKDVVILFHADTKSGASNKNVIINGFELNTPNAADQAFDPSPAHGDEHVDADKGEVTLSWKRASQAASHDVYFGTDPEAVYLAYHGSPLYRGNHADESVTVSDIYSGSTYYWRVDEIDAQGKRTRGDIWYFRPRQLAFPGAEGYGRFARGGRGGVVVHVTNLNDSGPGSLRDAVESDVGPRTIVFDVGGLIKLGARLTLSDSYVTVAGQTAPGKGIVLRAAPFGMSGGRDDVIQHVRVRLGAGQTYDGMGMQGSDHCMIDHSSISWTIDEAFSSRSGMHISLQRTLISEALNIANHQNYPPGTKHGYAASISGDIGSFHHNLLAHCEGRNWSLAGGLDPSGSYAGRLDIFNNVVYNWGGRTTDGGAHEVNFVGNYYRPGPASEVFVALTAQNDGFPGTQRYFFDKNVMPGYFDENSQDKGRKTAGMPLNYDPWVKAAFFPSYATVQSAGDAFKSVLSDVGCTEPVLDDHDARVIKETLNGTTTYKGSISGVPGLPDKESDVGGYESYPTVSRESDWDSDGDGLPDFWEQTRGLDPHSAAGDFSEANADADRDGYTELDAYLQWMAKPHYFLKEGETASIDLGKAFVGYTQSPTYTSADVKNGSVSVSGKTATFTPDKCGLASWRVQVTDGAGSSMSKDMVAFVACK